jgi:hypothetical protein
MTTLEAGRELDALVAEKVMGETVATFITDGEAHPLLWCDGSDLPNYSTDIRDAWQVVERMRSHGGVRFGNLHLVAYAYNRTYASFDSKDLPMMEGDYSVEANGEHATPLAICRAALAAVGAA